VIAAEEIEQFLQHIQDGRFTGKPALFDDVQSVENEALRSWLQLTTEQGGLLVTKPYLNEDHYPLKPLDVITRLGDYDIDREGYVQIRDDLKLMYQYVIPKLTEQGALPATIVREGQAQEIRIPVSVRRNLVIPSLNGNYPSYFIHGPMLFTTPSQEFLNAIGNGFVGLATLESPLILRRMDKPQDPEEQIVMLGPRLFPHATSEGYDNTAFAVVSQIQGTPVKNLRHAATLLRDVTDEFVRMDLVGAPTKVLTFKRQELLDGMSDVLDDEGIRQPFSSDLQDLFPANP